jgi:hypothetical protein
MTSDVYKLRIGAEWPDAADRRVSNVVNPATEEVARAGLDARRMTVARF